MRVYVLYVSGDYAHAVYISTDKRLCEQEKQRITKRNAHCKMYIKGYDFSTAKEFELDCD